jgi:hypothetical protein
MTHQEVYTDKIKAILEAKGLTPTTKETVMTASKKVNVSINPDTMAVLTEYRAKIAQELGFTPSYSEVIQYLIKQQPTNKPSA